MHVRVCVHTRERMRARSRIVVRRLRRPAVEAFLAGKMKKVIATESGEIFPAEVINLKKYL